MIPVFVGYDPREPIAFHVCVNSIIRNSSKPVSIIPLALNLLRYNEFHKDGSNQFIYSRFLVPSLMEHMGWAIYIDGDMIVKGDIAELWDMKHYAKDVLVVKHDYKTKMDTKYMGAKNENYPRKNWSSVILWNCGSATNKIITKQFVENSTGEELHRFSWINDDKIGELPMEWNWLDLEYEPNPDAKIIHYTLGIPAFHEYATGGMADEWHKEYNLTTFCKQN